ncbi:M48 family metalloprotease [candidate division GN15 bacterium]|nr:M48 family metalloprotease [candidate division GN15 bacterium]
MFPDRLTTMLCFAIPLCALFISGSHANEAEDDLEEWLKVYEDSLCILRGTMNHSSFTYLDPPLDSLEVFAERTDERWFLYLKDRPIRIIDTDTKNRGSKVEIEYESRDLGRQRIDIFSPSKEIIDIEVCEELMQQVFAFDDSPFPRYWLDTCKEIVHVRGTNHVPRCAYLVDDNLTSSGKYRQCPACFRQRVEIPGLSIEMALREGAVQTYELYNRVSFNDSLQGIARIAGQRVLDNWPLPLRGYDYRFLVTSSKGLNAMAFPAGLIYLHEGILAVVEDSVELEAVLAHEIAHVELRHGYRTLLKQQKGNLLSSIIALGVGVTAGAVSEDAEVGAAFGAATLAIADVATTLSVQGYRRAHELEADNIAALYLTENYGPDRLNALQSVLQKMIYAEDVAEYSFDASGMSTHPTSIERRTSLRSTQSLNIGRPTFKGVDSRNRMVATFNVYAIFVERRIVEVSPSVQRGYERRRSGGKDTTWNYTLYAAIETTEYLYKNREVKHMDVLVGDDELRFDNKQDTEIAPMAGVGCIFEMTSSRDIAFSSISSIDVDLGIDMRLQWEFID